MCSICTFWKFYLHLAILIQPFYAMCQMWIESGTRILNAIAVMCLLPKRALHLCANINACKAIVHPKKWNFCHHYSPHDVPNLYAFPSSEKHIKMSFCLISHKVREKNQTAVARPRISHGQGFHSQHEAVSLWWAFQSSGLRCKTGVN